MAAFAASTAFATGAVAIAAGWWARPLEGWLEAGRIAATNNPRDIAKREELVCAIQEALSKLQSPEAIKAPVTLAAARNRSRR